MHFFAPCSHSARLSIVGAAAVAGLLSACPVNPVDAGVTEPDPPLDSGIGLVDSGLLPDPDGGAPDPADAGEDGGAIVADAGVADAGRLADGGALEDAGGADGGSVLDAGPTPGDLDVSWIAGAANCGQSDQEPLQVHAYGFRTWILRQSKCTNYEGPFLFLLVGDERALLLDSGATQNAATVPVRATVEAILADHLAATPGAPDRADFELVVGHTHGHGDHTAGDGQFSGQPATTVVGTGTNAVRNFFNLDDWPDGVVEYDLGGRNVEILPLPGHQNAHIAVYDRLTGLLLTGDSLYPGRLYIQNFGQYRTSINDLTVFAAERPVVWVLGTHIEMTSTPGVDYPIGTTHQPDEPPLELSFSHLLELQSALAAMGNNGEYEVHDRFIIAP